MPIPTVLTPRVSTVAGRLGDSRVRLQGSPSLCVGGIGVEIPSETQTELNKRSFWFVLESESRALSRTEV